MKKLDKLVSYIIKHSDIDLDKADVKDDLTRYISDSIMDSCRFGSDQMKLGNYIKDRYDVDPKKAFPIPKKIIRRKL